MIILGDLNRTLCKPGGPPVTAKKTTTGNRETLSPGNREKTQPW